MVTTRHREVPRAHAGHDVTDAVRGGRDPQARRGRATTSLPSTPSGPRPAATRGTRPGTSRCRRRRNRPRRSSTRWPTIIEEQEIEWLLPMFEEVFYLAAHRDRLEGGCELFFPDFDTLAKVHDKVSFAALCRELGLPVAESVTATSTSELQDAIGRWDHWFARAAYGRGGLNVLTNSGPLAGEGSVDEAAPTPDDPWLVQEYLEGVDLCSWSVAKHGQVVLHSTYRAPAHDRRPGRHRVRVRRRAGDARRRAADRRRARVARAGQLRLPPHGRRRPPPGGVQPAPDRRLHPRDARAARRRAVRRPTRSPGRRPVGAQA